MEKLVLVPYDKYQRLLEQPKMKPDHQEKRKAMQPPPGKRLHNEDKPPQRKKKEQTTDQNDPSLKKQIDKSKGDTSIHWISF